MGVPPKLSQQSEADSHGDVCERLRIPVLSSDARGLIAKDLKMPEASDFELSIVHRLGFCEHGDLITVFWKFRFINWSLAGHGALMPGIVCALHHVWLSSRVWTGMILF